MKDIDKNLESEQCPKVSNLHCVMWIHFPFCGRQS